MIGQPSVENKLLARLHAGELGLGMIVRVCRTGEIAKIAASTDHDFIFMDAQHGAFNIETIGAICHVAHGSGVAPIVRVRGSADPDIGRILDAGAMGIVVPDVNDAAQARQAVDAAKFAPIGGRSIAGGYPLYNFMAVPAADAAANLNRNTAVICMIETREGVRNVDEIAAVDGVDVLHIGCNDLLLDMGMPGAFGCPEIVDAIGKVIAAAKANGKYAGLGGDKDKERQMGFIRDGIQFVTTHSDFAFLMAEATRRTESLRAAK